MINALSVQEQCHDTNEAHAALDKIISCLTYIRPIVQANRGTLACRSDVENRSLISGEPFQATLNRVKAVNGELPKRWYQFTKNVPFLESDDVAITVTNSTVGTGACTGHIQSELAHSGITWISFDGTKIHGSKTLNVALDQITCFQVSNVTDEVDLSKLLPVFKHSEKHGAEPYYDHVRKEHVAGMPIRDETEASALVRSGISYGGDIFSYHKPSRRFFRFKLTLGNIFHGFEINERELPPGMKAQLT
jgi:hypothetical protein